MNDENSDTNNIPHDVIAMYKAMAYLTELPTSMQNSDFIAIVQQINAYLRKYCTHNIIEDDIDLTPESSKRIYYCEYCLQTFIDKG